MFEIQYIASQDGMRNGSFMFGQFDFLDYTQIMEYFSKSKQITISEFKLVANRRLLFVRFIKVRKFFRKEKTYVTISDGSYRKRLRIIKEHSRCFINEWINKAILEASPDLDGLRDFIDQAIKLDDGG